MNYNDFPILSNEDYYLLNTQYSNQQKPDRKNHIYKICNELNTIVYSCFELAPKHNTIIKRALESTREISAKLLNNLNEVFNLTNTTSKNYANTNIFTLTKQISKASSRFINWASLEEKEYYKNLSLKSSTELLECLNNILNALELSNVKLFKHM